MGRGSGPTRDAAKESAAARALARLPRSSRSPGRLFNAVQSTNQPSSSTASQRSLTRSAHGMHFRPGWRSRMAKREREGGGQDGEVDRAQSESRETSQTAPQPFRSLTAMGLLPPPPFTRKVGHDSWFMYPFAYTDAAWTRCIQVTIIRLLTLESPGPLFCQTGLWRNVFFEQCSFAKVPAWHPTSLATK